MVTIRRVSTQTRNNWLIDGFLFSSAIVAFLSGIYFLFLPVGGYQGGRNPMYGITILFERHTWGDLHTWGGVAMIAIAAIHIPMHWGWIVNMTKRVGKMMTGRCKSMNARGKYNLAVDGVVGLSFLVTAVTGLYFLLIPGASHESTAPDPLFLFNRFTWDFIHTWSGVILIAAAVLHFAIHWKWAVKVTKKIILSISQKFTQTASRQGATR